MYLKSAHYESFKIEERKENKKGKKNKGKKKGGKKKAGKKKPERKVIPCPEIPEFKTLEEQIEWKRDHTKSFPKNYHPQFVESFWQSWWEKKEFFSPKAADAVNRPQEEKFIMVIPPPNVTGSLHIGHALTNAVEDCVTRWNRMKGKATLWVPGCDHAGIAT